MNSVCNCFFIIKKIKWCLGLVQYIMFNILYGKKKKKLYGWLCECHFLHAGLYISNDNKNINLITKLNFLTMQTYHSYCMGYMMPLGMGMDCPTPWMYPPYVPPHFMMPYNRFAPAQISGYGNQVVPVTYH